MGLEMARKAIEPTVLEGIANPVAEARMDGVAEQVAHQSTVAERRTELLRRELGFEGLMTRQSLEDEARFLVQRTAECALELGKRLLLLKEMSVHGEWAETLERIGIEERGARRVMSAAQRTSNPATLAVLANSAKSQSKLFELMVLDDDELKSLAEGESAAGLTLDDVDRMSVRELRFALRESRGIQKEELAAKDRVIEQQQGAVTHMQETVARLEHRVGMATPDEVRLALAGALTQATEMVRANLHVVLEFKARDLLTHGEATDSPETEVVAGVLRKLCGDILGVAQRLGVDVGAEDFSWATKD